MKMREDLVGVLPRVVQEGVEDLLDDHDVAAEGISMLDGRRGEEDLAKRNVEAAREGRDGLEAAGKILTKMVDDACCRVRIDVPNDGHRVARPLRELLEARRRRTPWRTMRSKSLKCLRRRRLEVIRSDLARWMPTDDVSMSVMMSRRR